MKRFIALICVVAMVFSCCSALAESTFLTDEKVTLTCFSRTEARTPTDLNEMIFWDYYENMTNVHIELSYAADTEFLEKLNLKIASNDIPDIIFCGIVNSDFIQQNASAGVLIPLNDLIEEYAPNLTAIFEERPDWKLDSTLSDGNIYVMPNISMPYRTNSMTMINTKWLETLGLQMPTNLDELYEVLVAFRDQDPNGNGKQDELPMVFPNTTNLYNTMAWFDLLNGDNFCYEDANGQVVFTPTTDNFKEWLHFMNKLYAEKLLDNDVFVTTSSQVIANGSGDDQRNGMSVANGVTNFVEGAHAYDFGCLPVLTSASGQKLWPARIQCQAQTRCFMVTSNCKYPEIAVKWCDYFYTQAGAELIWMGIEDYSYTRTENGYEWLEPYYNEESNKQRLEATGASTSIMPDLWLTADPWTNLSGQTNMLRSQFQDSGDLTVAFPVVYYAEDESADLAAYATDVNTYVQMMIAEFITGKSDIDAQWDSFQSQLKMMGYEKMVAIMQKAVDARNANK